MTQGKQYRQIRYICTPGKQLMRQITPGKPQKKISAQVSQQVKKEPS